MFRCGACRTCKALLSLLAPLLVHAEQLPIRIYRTAEGLGNDAVYSIVTDKNGYLWFGTGEGLLRFDGYEFTNYGLNEGLPNAEVNAVLVTRNGELWVATARGLCHFNIGRRVLAGQRFTVYQPSIVRDTQNIRALAEDRDGSIWCGTRAGVFRLRRLASARMQFEPLDVGEPRAGIVNALQVDHEGALWIGAEFGLYRRGPEGQTRRFTADNGLTADPINAMLQDRRGRIWVCTLHALSMLAPRPDPHGRVVKMVYPLAERRITAALEASDGRIWLASYSGLWGAVPGDAPGEIKGFLNYGTGNGLSDLGVNALGEDRDGNLWLGSESGGAMRIARHGIYSYTEADGLNGMRIRSLFENRTGELFAIAAIGGRTETFLQRLDGNRFTMIPVGPKGSFELGWSQNQIGFEDHAGEWWVATAHGLCRFPHVARFDQLQYTRPKAIYAARDGLAGNLIFRVFEDSRGDIWISATGERGENGHGLSRWQRSTGTLRHFSREPGFANDSLPVSFREDRTGALWIGFWNGGVARYSHDRFLFLGPDEGMRGGPLRISFRTTCAACG